MDIIILGGKMKKVVRDFVLLFVMSFIYLSFYKAINISTEKGIIISLGTAGVFSLLNNKLLNLDEDGLKTKITISDEELEKIRKIRLVIRDSLLTFLVCYGTMTVYLGETTISLIKAVSFVIAALAPALVVFAISKEIRIPSKRETVTEGETQIEELA